MPKDCPMLELPNHGNVTFDSEQLVPGTNAEFTCKEGYEMLTEFETQCLITKQWKEFEDRYPTCTRKHKRSNIFQLNKYSIFSFY